MRFFCKITTIQRYHMLLSVSTRSLCFCLFNSMLLSSVSYQFCLLIYLFFDCAGSSLLCRLSLVVGGLLIAVASLVVEHRLSGCSAQGLVALRHMESYRTRDWTHVPCIGRWTPNHWATREVLSYWFFLSPSSPWCGLSFSSDSVVLTLLWSYIWSFYYSSMSW